MGRGAGGALCGLCRCGALGVVGLGWVAFLFGGWRLVRAQGRAPPVPRPLGSPLASLLGAPLVVVGGVWLSGSLVCLGYRVFVRRSAASGFFGI